MRSQRSKVNCPMPIAHWHRPVVQRGLASCLQAWSVTRHPCKMTMAKYCVESAICPADLPLGAGLELRRLSQCQYQNVYPIPSVLLLMRCHAMQCLRTSHAGICIKTGQFVKVPKTSTPSQWPASIVLHVCNYNVPANPEMVFQAAMSCACASRYLLLPLRRPDCCANLVSRRCPPHETSFMSDTKD